MWRMRRCVILTKDAVLRVSLPAYLATCVYLVLCENPNLTHLTVAVNKMNQILQAGQLLRY